MIFLERNGSLIHYHFRKRIPFFIWIILLQFSGKKTGKNYLEPAWTNFAKRIYYMEYDLSGILSKGKNCISVNLRNGFYNPLPMKMWGSRNLREPLPTGKPQFVAKIRLEYEDGKTVNIITDGSWRFSYGPLLKNNVYPGVV